MKKKIKRFFEIYKYFIEIYKYKTNGNIKRN